MRTIAQENILVYLVYMEALYTTPPDRIWRSLIPIRHNLRFRRKGIAWNHSIRYTYEKFQGVAMRLVDYAHAAG